MEYANPNIQGQQIEEGLKSRGKYLTAFVCLLFAILHDVTERKRVEAELAEYRHHLEELVAQRTNELARSNRDLEQFAYVASHDLQEPLRMVASYTQLLSERYRSKLDEKADTDVTKVEKVEKKPEEESSVEAK